MSPFLGVSGLGGPGSSIVARAPDKGLSDTYWIASYGNNFVSTENAHGIAVDDNDGSVYAVGNTHDQSGSGGSPYSKIFLVKYDKSGTLQWQRTLDGSGEEYGRGVGVDSSGNVYICGHSDLNSYGGASDIVIAKYNSSGVIQWQKRFGGSSYEYSESGMKVDGDGNSYIPMRDNSTDNKSLMGWVSFDSSGNKRYQRTVNNSSTSYDGMGALDVDLQGNVYICGRTNYQYGIYQGIIMKFPAGTEEQAEFQYNMKLYYPAYGNQNIYCYSIAVANNGDLFIGGTASYTYSNNISNEAFVAYLPVTTGGGGHQGTGYNSNGTSSFCKTLTYLGGGSVWVNSTMQYGSVKIASDGKPIFTGQIQSISGSYGTGNNDWFIMKVDPDLQDHTSSNSRGAIEFFRILDNTRTYHYQNTSTSSDEAHGLALDSDGNMYVAGRYGQSGDVGAIIAKLPGDGALADVQAPGTSYPIKYAGRFIYRDKMNEYNFGVVINGQSSVPAVAVGGTINTSNSTSLSLNTLSLTEAAGTVGHTVGIISDRTRPTATYDYSFPNEVYYGGGGVGSGSTDVPLGTQSYHYSGDGTMPAISLGSAVQNWDMFFESYLSYFDQAQQSNHWAIGTDGYGDTNGFLLGFYDSGVTGNMSIAHPSGAYAIYSGVSVANPIPNSPVDNRPMREQWNWFKLEWRGGTSFKIWHKNTPTGTYSQLYSTTSNVYNGTNWNFLSIGRVKGTSSDNFASVAGQQFYGKIKNFGLNVDSNVVNL